MFILLVNQLKFNNTKIPLSLDLLSKPSITDCSFVSIVSEPSFLLGKIPTTIIILTSQHKIEFSHRIKIY